MSSLLKQETRQKLLSLRNSMSVIERDTAEDKLKIKLQEFLEKHTKTNFTIAIYYPNGSELNILTLVKDLPYKLALPVIQKNSKILKFYLWNPEEKLHYSKIYSNILEPKNTTQEIVPDIVIAPLIACDLEGNRIGSGKAMYDHTIAHLRKINPQILYVGICFNCQIVEKIPSQSHDQKLDYILY